ncbi:MAG: lysophospholipid acyltransferase family protein [Acidimicrobiales bacterium]
MAEPARPDSLQPSPAEAVRAAEMGGGARLAYRGLRGLVWLIARLLVRVSVTGIEKVPKTGGYILAPGGHRSILDTPLASLASPRVLRYMGAENYFKIPGLGLFLRVMGGFPVERSMTDRMALRLSEEVLRNGEPLVVFPEGTRQEGPIVKPLKEGASFLACRASVPIVPVGIGGAERAMPKGARYVRPGKVAIIVGEPLHPPERVDGQRVKRSAVSDLTAELHQRLQELFDEAQVNARA